MLRLENLSVARAGLPLIHSVSAELKPGSIVGLIGPNGAGKSSLLKGISGIWPVVSGELTLDKESLTALTRKQRSQKIAYVPQSPQCHFPFTVKELISMGRYPLSAYGLKEEPLLFELLEQTDLSHLAHRPITEISGGERQRAYIARALAQQAKVLLLDEPTSSLDLRHQKEIIALLHSLKAQGRIIIVAIHDLYRAAEWTDELLLLDQGKAIIQGKPEDVLTPTLMTQVFKIDS